MVSGTIKAMLSGKKTFRRSCCAWRQGGSGKITYSSSRGKKGGMGGSVESQKASGGWILREVERMKEANLPQRVPVFLLPDRPPLPMRSLVVSYRARRIRRGGVGPGAFRGDLDPDIGESYPVRVLQGKGKRLTPPIVGRWWLQLPGLVQPAKFRVHVIGNDFKNQPQWCPCTVVAAYGDSLAGAHNSTEQRTLHSARTDGFEWERKKATLQALDCCPFAVSGTLRLVVVDLLSRIQFVFFPENQRK